MEGVVSSVRLVFSAFFFFSSNIRHQQGHLGSLVLNYDKNVIWDLIRLFLKIYEETKTFLKLLTYSILSLAESLSETTNLGYHF